MTYAFKCNFLKTTTIKSISELLEFTELSVGCESDIIVNILLMGTNIWKWFNLENAFQQYLYLSG